MKMLKDYRKLQNYELYRTMCKSALDTTDKKSQKEPSARLFCCSSLQELLLFQDVLLFFAEPKRAKYSVNSAERPACAWP